MLRLQQVLEEVVALVVDEDERREVLDGNLADGFHAEFREGDDVVAQDVLLGEDSSRATDRAEVEAAVLVASVRHVLAAVALSDHNHRGALALEAHHVRVHTAGSRRAEASGGHAFRRLGALQAFPSFLAEISIRISQAKHSTA